MSEITERQAEHLQILLNEQGISQAQLACELEFSPTSVNRWVKGKARMRDDSAEIIHKRWPEYSVEWLQGGMGIRETIDDMRERAEKLGADYKRLEDAVMALMESAQYSCECVQDEPAVPTIKNDDGRRRQIRFAVHEWHKIAKGGSEMILDNEQWTLFLFEMRQYIDMRLGFMMAASREGR